MPEVITIHSERIVPRVIRSTADLLRSGAIGVVPTDTGYAIVCSAENKKGVKTLHRLKSAASQDSRKLLSVLFPDMSSLSNYIHSLPNPVYRVLRRTLPGPYTFIMKATKRLSAAALKGRNTLGVRIPDHAVVLALLSELNAPLLATGLKNPEDETRMSDPLEAVDAFGPEISFIVDSGPLPPEPSTIVDFTSGEAEIIRVGKGPVHLV